VTIEYLMSPTSLTHEVEVDAVQMKGCKENVSVENAELVNSTYVVTDYNSTSQKLTVTHDINKSLLGNSSIYNATTNKLNVCQRIKLVLKTSDADGSTSNMIIVEDVREIEVDFDLDFDYTIYDTSLAAATIEQNQTEINFDSYIEAYKCNLGENYAPDNNPLAPNTMLHICIHSLSSDVLIDALESMVRVQ